MRNVQRKEALPVIRRPLWSVERAEVEACSLQFPLNSLEDSKFEEQLEALTSLNLRNLGAWIFESSNLL